MNIITYILSKNSWDAPPISVLVQQIKDSSRKIQKGIDVGIERSRFNNACTILEEITIRKGKQIKPAQDKVQEFLNNWSENNFLLPFIEFDKAKAIISSLATPEKKQFLENKSSIVLVLDEYGKGSYMIKTEEVQSKTQAMSNIHEFNILKTDKQDQKRFDEQILHAIKTGTPIGWINLEHINSKNISGTTFEERRAQIESQRLLRHEGIITCLREHIYVINQPSEIKEVDVEKKWRTKKQTKKGKKISDSKW